MQAVSIIINWIPIGKMGIERTSSVELGNLRHQLGLRRMHYDGDVSKIAASFLSGNCDFLDRIVLESEAKAHRPEEIAILLEKTAIKKVIDNLWQEALTGDLLFERHLEEVSGKLKQTSWNDVVKSITYDEILDVLGTRMVKTNLLDRYAGIAKEVILPLLADNKTVSVVEAGASGSMNVQSAIDAGLNVSTWASVDLEKPDYEWILTCSIRMSEILSGDWKKYLDRILNHPKGLSIIQGDMNALPFANESFDIYFASLSWYQSLNAERAVQEAQRVVRDKGLVIVTDNAKKTDSGLIFSESWQSHELSTFVWYKKDGELVGPFNCAVWANPKCDQALSFPEFAELSRVVANS